MYIRKYESFENNKFTLTENIKSFLSKKSLFVDKVLHEDYDIGVYELTNGNILKIEYYNFHKMNIYRNMIGNDNTYFINVINVMKFNKYLILELENLDEIPDDRFENLDNEILSNYLEHIINHNFKNFNDSISNFDYPSEYDDMINLIFNANYELQNKYKTHLINFELDKVMLKNNKYKIVEI